MEELMGWTILQRVPSEGMKAFIDREVFGGVVASVIGDDGNYYAAVTAGPGVVVGYVGLIEGAGYKLMSEAEGPYYYGAPAAILDKLTPTDEPSALNWRNKCRWKDIGAAIGGAA
jgi:hypothetical protein